MPAALLATTLMLALGQSPIDANAAAPTGVVPVPANSPGFGPGPAFGAAHVQGPGTACAPNGNGPQGDGGIPGNSNYSYTGYRLTPGYGDGAGTPTHAYAYPNYDAYEPWVHGHWQELPAFGGHAYFRPYNYRHVYVQSEIATSWGTSSVMPYSQEYFRRPREQGIFEQRTSATGRVSYPSVAYRQQPRQQQNISEIARTAGIRQQPSQEPPAKQASSGPSLFPRARH